MSVQCLYYIFANVYYLCTILIQCVQNAFTTCIQLYSTCFQYLYYVCSMPKEYECNICTIHVQCVYNTLITCIPQYAFLRSTLILYGCNRYPIFVQCLYNTFTICLQMYTICALYLYNVCTMPLEKRYNCIQLVPNNYIMRVQYLYMMYTTRMQYLYNMYNTYTICLQ